MLDKPRDLEHHILCVSMLLENPVHLGGFGRTNEDQNSNRGTEIRLLIP